MVGVAPFVVMGVFSSTIQLRGRPGLEYSDAGLEEQEPWKVGFVEGMERNEKMVQWLEETMFESQRQRNDVSKTHRQDAHMV